MRGRVPHSPSQRLSTESEFVSGAGRHEGHGKLPIVPKQHLEGSGLAEPGLVVGSRKHPKVMLDTTSFELSGKLHVGIVIRILGACFQVKTSWTETLHDIVKLLRVESGGVFSDRCLHASTAIKRFWSTQKHLVGDEPTSRLSLIHI